VSLARPDSPSAASSAAAVRSGRADPVSLVEAALARLAGCDDEVRSFVHVDAEGALREAEHRRRHPTGGPLDGVPVAVKDLFDVAGQPTRAGSRATAVEPAARDAVAVRRLREAGAVVLGRTRTHEFAWGLTTWHPDLGGTRNPHDLTRTAGGSSGGSAAAVAAGIVPLALGTDTGCSIRLPAAWCGLVGHKPTHGSVPLDGVVPLAPSLDVGGALVRTVEDARLALSVLTGKPLAEPALPVPLRVGRVAGDGSEAVDRVVVSLDPAEVRDVELPMADRLARLYGVIQGAEALAVHRAAGWWPQRRDDYGADVRERVLASERLTEEQVSDARREREVLRAAAASLLDDLDVLVLPVAACGPSRTASPDDQPDGGEPLRGAVLPWTVLANLCGLPACAVPAGRDDDGLPVGVQLVGRPGDDALVLSLAARAEQLLLQP
jgi:aspartyl-tRNA(Asn)/glutamyl-tRNA(Gln) amidotransferase subunit A